MDKQFCITVSRGLQGKFQQHSKLNKLSPENIYKQFSDAILKRRNDTQGPDLQKFRDLDRKDKDAQELTLQKLSLFEYTKNPFQVPVTVSLEDKINEYNRLNADVQPLKKEVIILRHQVGRNEESDDQRSNDSHTATALELLTMPEFTDKFGSRSLHQHKSVRYIQTGLRSKTGLGTPFSVQFYAPKPELQHYGDCAATCDYDYKRLASDYELLKQARDSEYIHRQCLKICYYIRKMHDIEVLKMKCEFAKDINGTVWLQHASEIYARMCPLQKRANLIKEQA